MTRRTASSLITLVLFVASASVASAQEPPKPERPPRNVAILLFEGVQIIDFTGPYEVLGQAWNNGRVFNVFTVAEKPGPLTTNMGMVVTPNYSFADCPKPDVLVIPGGGVRKHLDNTAVVSWVRERTGEAEYVMSVCNGAFFLGKAGLLDGLTATTFYGLIDELKTIAPKCTVVRDQRFVDNGKIITTAGLSSGMDGALHLIERVAGFGVAQSTALNLEYNWQPEVPYARASFADRHLRAMLGRTGFDIPPDAGWKALGQKGDATEWEKRWEVQSKLTVADLMKIVDAKLAESWKRDASTSAERSMKSTWRFTDEDGRPWAAVATVAAVPQSVDTLHLSVRLHRAGGSR